MNPQQVLDHLLNLERRVRDVYRTLSERTEFPDQLRSFWRSMAEDETHHIITLERSAHLFEVMERAPSGLDADIAKVEETIAQAESTVRRAVLTSDDALLMGLTIEGSELNQLDETWLQSFRSTSRLLLEALTPSHESHIRRLVDAVHRFSVIKELHVTADTLWSRYEQQHDHTKRTPGSP
ncbi:MAG: hypothetical protein AB7G75_11145 [Candidatus Binatia bacterium]